MLPWTCDIADLPRGIYNLGSSYLLPQLPQIAILWTKLRNLLLPVLIVSSTAKQVTDLSSYEWILSSIPPNITVPAAWPSYAHLDLYAAGAIPEPDYGLNDFELRWVWRQNWTYSTDLTGLKTHTGLYSYLLFEGLDTFTSIELCGQHVASTNNQFRQYYFDITAILAKCPGSASLSINFGSAPQIAEAIANQPGQETWPFGVEQVFEIPNRQFIRKQQNDFGWDWGPAFAPAGPWQPGYVVQLNRGELHARNVLVDIYKRGQRNNLIPDQSQPWILNASIDYIGTLRTPLRLVYMLQDMHNKTIATGPLQNLTRRHGTVTGTTILQNDQVDLWWPVGMGPQTLYKLLIAIVDEHGQYITTVSRRIGFRTIVLNELPVTSDQIALGVAPGNNWHYEINGHVFFAKGSNFIPPDTFWPRVTPGSIKSLFDAAVAGNQNMLRVWASGAYSPDFMYDLADEMGILLWSEFEFGDDLYPVNAEFLNNVYEEASYQVRRLNHHPSLAYWAGGNELENLEIPIVYQIAPEKLDRYVKEYETLFLSTIFPAVFENSRSISYAPSSTSNGFISLNFTEAPYMQERYFNTTPGQVYGVTDYYQYDSRVAFNLSNYPIGRFSNEFGYHSMPSLQTWQEYIPQDELDFNSTYVLLRNRHYPPGSLNTTNYANTSKGMDEMTMAVKNWYPIPKKVDPIANFGAWCHATQIFQAEYYGSQIQFYRRGSGLPQRTLGSLYWQLEDQWAAPTWAGIEVSGRWKMLHYRAKDLYQNVIISPFHNVTDDTVEVWVTSDLWEAIDCTVNLVWYSFNGTRLPEIRGLSNHKIRVGAINSTHVYHVELAELLSGHDRRDLMMELSVAATGHLPNSASSTRFTHVNYFHASPLNMAHLVDPGLVVSHDSSSQTVTVSATRGVSVFTWLDYPRGALVFFEDNGFWLVKGESRTLKFRVVQDETAGRWIQGLTVESLWNQTLPY